MNRRLRTGIIIGVVGIGMIILGLIVLGQLVRRALAPLPAPTPLPVITSKVLVASHDIGIGTLLQPEDITQLDMPIELVPRNALNEVDQAAGRLAKVSLVAGELVLDHHLADPTNVSHDLAFVIGDNQVLIAFPASDLMSELGVLQPGDNVDILVSISQKVRLLQAGQQTVTGAEEQTATELFTFDAYQRAQISAIVAEVKTEEGTAPVSAQVVSGQGGTPVPTPTPLPGQAKVKAYLLAVSPQDALVLKHLRDAGATFDIVLRSPTSTELYELSPVFSQYVNDRYQLEIEK